MKKFFFLILAAIVGITTVFGQSFTQVKTTMKYKKAFYVCTEDSLLEVDAYRYSAVSKAPSDFYVGEFNSPRGSFRVVLHKSEFLSEMTSIDSLGVSGEFVEVYLANDSVYLTKNLRWLETIVGQQVVHTKIVSSQRTFERYRTITELEADCFVENIPDKLMPYFFTGGSPLPEKAPASKKIEIGSAELKTAKKKTVTSIVSKEVTLIES